jgi:phosphoribosyl-ATP pyrophosphohydrolase/phosphoribosyl-AMP cyclohydrolase
VIIPSIDLRKGSAVQLVGGRELALDAGDPMPWLERFRLAGEVAVVDLDAALGEGSNRDLIASLCAKALCRVGGGIRDLEAARFWLDAGAARIVIGTAASASLLRQLPKERLIVALDALDGDVVVDGWRTRTGRTVTERMGELREFVSGFLVTFVEREGRLAGTDLGRVAPLVDAAGDARVTIAGGVTTADEVAALDRLGADAQVGMALYTGRLSLGAAVAAPMKSERTDGLVPTVVVDDRGCALGLAWSSRDSVSQAVDERRGVYQSRTRGRWVKGERSGATQELLRVELDCDRDTLRFSVRQNGVGFCHGGTATCWGGASATAELERTIRERLATPVEGSYTNRLASDAALLGAKLVEEAGELASAATADEVVRESADLLYFTLVRLAASGVSLVDVESELARRALRVTRRDGAAKRHPERGACHPERGACHPERSEGSAVASVNADSSPLRGSE